jgi:hypothetical protein
MGLIAEGAGLRWSFAAIALVLALILLGLARLRHASLQARPGQL